MEDGGHEKLLVRDVGTVPRDSKLVKCSIQSNIQMNMEQKVACFKCALPQLSYHI